MVEIVLVVNVCKSGSKLGIGSNDSVEWCVPEDLENFEKLTNEKVVVLGGTTFKNIGEPLKNRKNYILSKKVKKGEGYTVFETKEELDKAIEKEEVVYVIGGEKVYKGYIKTCDKILLTQIYGKYNCDTFFPEITSDFCISEYSEILISKISGVKYRYITLIRNTRPCPETGYLSLAKDILNKGQLRQDRTGTGTVSLFGKQIKFDISRSVPLLTTKTVPWKTVILEMLWMISGNTDSKWLEERNIGIWKGNTSREFLDSQGLDYPEGELAYGYGHQMRNSGGTRNSNDGVDQLMYIENLLKTDPYSRRILWNLWSPTDLKRTPLMPCHYSFQLYVETENGENYLSGMLVLRSNDIFLGNPFNILGYSVLIYILAMKCDMNPRELTLCIGDAHIYTNHLNQMTEQISRAPRVQPVLELDKSIKHKKYSEIDISDFKIIGYFPCDPIRGDMAI